jgi:hypothetical protein
VVTAIQQDNKDLKKSLQQVTEELKEVKGQLMAGSVDSLRAASVQLPTLPINSPEELTTLDGLLEGSLSLELVTIFIFIL